MVKSIVIGILSLLLVGCCVSKGCAEPLLIKPILSGEIGIESSYMGRGVDQFYAARGGHPTVFVDATITAGKVYGGAYSSRVDFGDGANQELDFWVGVRVPVKGFTLDTSVNTYNYIGGMQNWNMIEFREAVSHPVGKGTVTLVGGYSPDYFNFLHKSYYGELNGSYPITDKLTVSGAAGYQRLQRHNSYGTYNIGASYQITRHVVGDVRWYDTNRHSLDPVFHTYDGRMVGSLKYVF